MVDATEPEKVASTKMKSNPIYETKIRYVEEGGYYSKNWVACSNCKLASPEYKKICPSCKGMGGRYVKGNYIPKTKRKIEDKNNSGWDGTNESGFSGLPGGNRNYNGIFVTIGGTGYWWSSTEYSTSLAWYRGLYSTNGDVSRYFPNNDFGFSVRCLRD